MSQTIFAHHSMACIYNPGRETVRSPDFSSATADEILL